MSNKDALPDDTQSNPSEHSSAVSQEDVLSSSADSSDLPDWLKPQGSDESPQISTEVPATRELPPAEEMSQVIPPPSQDEGIAEINTNAPDTLPDWLVSSAQEMSETSSDTDASTISLDQEEDDMQDDALL